MQTRDFDVPAVVERLTSTRETERREGYDAGFNWAQKYASIDGLKILSTFEDKEPPPAFDLAVMLSDQLVCTDESAESFFLEYAGVDLNAANERPWRIGFIEGAIHVYRTVRPFL